MYLRGSGRSGVKFVIYQKERFRFCYHCSHLSTFVYLFYTLRMTTRHKYIAYHLHDNNFRLGKTLVILLRMVWKRSPQQKLTTFHSSNPVLHTATLYWSISLHGLTSVPLLRDRSTGCIFTPRSLASPHVMLVISSGMVTMTTSSDRFKFWIKRQNNLNIGFVLKSIAYIERI